jgi:hypothetical protein
MAHSGLPAIGSPETMRGVKTPEIRNSTEHPCVTLFRLRDSCLRGWIINQGPL